MIIVSYNVRHYLLQCLRSVKRASRDIDTEIIVIDNHSRDGSADYVRAHCQGVNLIESNHNLGFSRANNIGIRQSTGDYILLLNPDTIVAENTLESVLSFMDNHPKAGGAGVMMYKADGSVAKESRRGLPSPATAFYKMCGLCNLYPRNRRFGKYYMGYLPWDSPQKIEVVSGAFFMIRRRALLQTGLLDEDFFMYGEDIDLSYRLLQAGWENWYLPYPILHYKGESTQKTSFRYVHVFYNAMLIFLQKHYNNIGVLLTLPIKAAIYIKATLALVATQSRRVGKSLGFTGRREKQPEYLFVGSAEMTGYCQALANRQGLTSRQKVVETGDVAMTMEPLLGKGQGELVVVFDTDIFSYSDILAIMAKYEGNGAVMATYYSKTKTIITPNDILK